MNRLLTPHQMTQAEAASVTLGTSLWELMTNAGTALADFIQKKCSECGFTNCVFLCGNGNNGGDGFVCAEILAKSGLNATVVLMCGEPKTELGKRAFSQLSNAEICDNYELAVTNADIIVDCIFGTGFHGEFRGNIKEKLTLAQQTDCCKIACDMPSGVDCLRGTAAQGTLKCSATVTFHAAKLGMYLKPAKGFCGEIIVCDIKIPDGWENFLDDKTLSENLTHDILHGLLPTRPECSHKGTFGKLLIVAGSESYIGAAAICSRAALHTGCGIVNLAAPEIVVRTIAATAPECVYTTLATENGFIGKAAISKLIDLANQSQAVVIGCGLGQSESTQKIVEELVKNVEKPLVIDADGINQLAKNIDILRERKCEIILTPHIGELARLGGCTVNEAVNNRYEICRNICEKYGITLHSKDTSTVTFTPQNAYVTSFGCSALAKGGSGDMLAGIIGSLLAQGKPSAQACVLASFIMGRSAEILCESLSPAAVTATDIISAFSRTLMQI